MHTPCVSTPTGISPVLGTTQIDELTDPTLPSPPPTMESKDTLRVARTVDPWPAEVMSGPYDSLGRCAIASALEEKQSGFGSIDPVVPPGTRWCKPMLAQLPWARCAESECAVGETIDRHDQLGQARAKKAAIFAVRARYERSFMLTSGPTNYPVPTTGTTSLQHADCCIRTAVHYSLAPSDVQYVKKSKDPTSKIETPQLRQLPQCRHQEADGLCSHLIPYAQHTPAQLSTHHVSQPHTQTAAI